MIRSMQSALLEPMREVAGPAIENYFLTEDHFALRDGFPYNVSPLTFLDYDEEKILDRITSLGWTKLISDELPVTSSTRCASCRIVISLGFPKFTGRGSSDMRRRFMPSTRSDT